MRSYEDDPVDTSADEYDAGVIAGTAAGRLAAETGASTITTYDPDRTPWKDGYADGFVAGYHAADAGDVEASERHPDAYSYGEPWGPDNPAPGSPRERQS